MKRRQKRVLQMAFLFMVALIFLPNVGLWSMYREKSLMKSHEPGEQGFPLGLNEVHIYTWTDGLRRRDWHDNESIRKDSQRVGKGEHGKPYPLAEDECDDSVYKENGFNIYVSNNIALDRSLPDIRHPNCKQKLYLENLPNTSIIIPFHNEGWSSLLRTIHSITNRTPDHLIAEIILVDDYSDKVNLEAKQTLFTEATYIDFKSTAKVEALLVSLAASLALLEDKHFHHVSLSAKEAFLGTH
ncbi:polypeptide N-acetylgalactosaminyltransferase-like 6 [Sinocyclocheilus rhinocerous]|uniref:polypeptide N-acetylgalactosaminyltransferase-like 6 n=1 Tax=Sinocyclocheilus rhinocerous TaxID=307959 RepID=UPI0007B8B7B5|nr:PREDICTED: polypeptide N-acetylgalactosaminyltransferase-like 6 [Sinocyclocheilus rhinocerous]